MKFAKKGLDSFQLKLIALIVMILAHTDVMFGYSTAVGWLHLLSRFVSPVFVFLMVVGFFHTSSRKRYALRLWGFGAAVLAGNLLIGLFTGRTAELISHTIILTLALCFSIIWALDTARAAAGRRRVSYALLFCALLLIGFAGGLTVLEGALEAVPLALIVYLCYPLRRGRLWMCLGIAALSLLLGGLMLPVQDGAVDWYTFFTIGSDWAQFLVIPFILLYNGRPGPKTWFSKWMFYLLYPAHLWIFALIGCLLGHGA